MKKIKISRNTLKLAKCINWLNLKKLILFHDGKTKTKMELVLHKLMEYWKFDTRRKQVLRKI